MARARRIPWRVRLFGPVLKWLLLAGVPVGPNQLVTIRGRTTGQARTTPLAVIRTGGRRWVWAPWSASQWPRNLRAAGQATITMHGRAEAVRATELDASERVAFFRNVLGPPARSVPFGALFIRIVDGVDVNDPVGAAEGRAVFEFND